MTATQPIGLNTNISFSEISSINAFIGTPITQGTQGTGATSPISTANISQSGQLLSNLQQLQAQNPTEFTSLTGQIATQLQNAAQAQSQAGNNAASQFLMNLSNMFENASTTNSLSQLLAQLQMMSQHHHHNSTYDSNGMTITSTTTTTTTSTTNFLNHFSGGSAIGQMLSTISQEVSQALTAPTAATGAAAVAPAGGH